MNQPCLCKTHSEDFRQKRKAGSCSGQRSNIPGPILGAWGDLPPQARTEGSRYTRMCSYPLTCVSDSSTGDYPPCQPCQCCPSDHSCSHQGIGLDHSSPFLSTEDSTSPVMLTTLGCTKNPSDVPQSWKISQPGGGENTGQVEGGKTGL